MNAMKRATEKKEDPLEKLKVRASTMQHNHPSGKRLGRNVVNALQPKKKGK